MITKRIDRSALSRWITAAALVLSFLYIGCGTGRNVRNVNWNYKPTPISGGAIPQEAIATLKPGLTKRRDVLLNFGEPRERLPEDRYLIYGWHQTGSLVGSPFSVPNTYLCMEFDGAGLLVKRVVATGGCGPESDNWKNGTNGTGARP